MGGLFPLVRIDTRDDLSVVMDLLYELEDSLQVELHGVVTGILSIYVDDGQPEVIEFRSPYIKGESRNWHLDGVPKEIIVDDIIAEIRRGKLGSIAMGLW